MSNGGIVEKDHLFVGLTRPTMLFGVSQNLFGLNLMICGCLFIYIHSMWLIAVGICLHIIAVLICLKEPRALELLQIKLALFPHCSNYAYHGANSYEP